MPRPGSASGLCAHPAAGHGAALVGMLGEFLLEGYIVGVAYQIGDQSREGRRLNEGQHVAGVTESHPRQIQFQLPETSSVAALRWLSHLSRNT